MNILIVEQLRASMLPLGSLEKLLLTAFSILPSLHPQRLAAITPSEHQVTVVNERYQPIPIDQPFDLIIIHYTTVTAYRAYAIADEIKQFRKTPIVFCGLHAAALPDEALQHADSVLLGKNETNYVHLLSDVQNKRIKKIYPPEYPLPASIPPTHVHLPGFVIIGAIEATRGCPYKCSFCPESHTPAGDHFLVRPVDDVIEEIRQLPYKLIMFYDASLTINPSYTKELFTKMIPLKKRFFCNGNVDVLAEDEELIRLSKKAGCIAWLIGFESFSQQVINNVGKKTNVISKYKQVVDTIHKHHMVVIGDFMFGFDEDTKDVFQHTLSMINDLHIDIADFTVVTPFPGTPLYTQYDREQRIITKDWSQYSLHNVVFKPKHMSPLELSQGVQQLYSAFYQPKETIKRLLPRIRYGPIVFGTLLSRSILPIIASMKQRNKEKTFIKE